MAEDLKNTLNLPQTQFPMRANSVEREPMRIQHWEATELYKKVQEKNHGKPTFILHDGPPFTNGDVHIGTALNKILKDILVRYKSMNGYRAPYVPGWDCHGLPIEHKVMKELQAQKTVLSPDKLRHACADFSESFLKKQRTQFKRLGVIADWANEYKTKNPAYEAIILRTFATFVEKGLVYRSKKPVYWSIPCETALAEAEVEYKDHVSDSIWVRFPIIDCDRLETRKPASVVIWTTTPWTIPANLAIAVHPELIYVEVDVGNEVLLVAQPLAETFLNDCGLSGKFGKTHSGSSLEGLQTRHPFIDRKSPVVLADYVTTESGTGCVHTAPGHGLEDYFTGIRYGLEPYSPLDDAGCYLNDGRIPQKLVGLSVADIGNRCPANEAVLELLKANNALLCSRKYTHSYPHCWRSKAPVIFRAMEQWFVSLDDSAKKVAFAEIEKTRWVPSWGENRIKGAVEGRPDWCISRQRAWGVPIPAFYDADGNPLLDAKVIRGIAEKVAQGGSNVWFEKTVEELLEGIELPEPFRGKKLTKGRDTLDVWIDSGCSHRAVLQQNKDLQWPADLYLEGSDQHRGWFQSSLWTGLLADGRAPYKAVLTHGFVVDENKKKISKSEGKPQTADSYIQKWGADILRLWIASTDYTNDIPISEDILQQIVSCYRTIRNTLRFQIGNLFDFSFEKNAVDELSSIDRWALHQTNDLIEKVTETYDQYAFHKVYQLVNRFCAVTLSATYHDILKDRLYTYAPDWHERRSAQTVIYKTFHALIGLLAPILALTTDEALDFFLQDKDFSKESVHLRDFPKVNPSWAFNEADEIDALLAFRSRVHEQLESARQQKLLGQSLDAKVVIQGPQNDPIMQLLHKYHAELCELFIVSQVSLHDASELSVTVTHADGVRCPRSWRWVDKLVDCKEYGPVSERCQKALLKTRTM
ncbi:MAG: isoleucine--tRNA ligase [Verrucomicrobia bacterium GWF2_51_19]|nr:MAG: isoleucine--tRNA ligase [Verrucomicrobia bacterium GWF2_51_19]HCJ11731.1 isoleucine--tRNA ligase [Opitutae bacterium]